VSPNPLDPSPPREMAPLRQRPIPKNVDTQKSTTVSTDRKSISDLKLETVDNLDDAIDHELAKLLLPLQNFENELLTARLSLEGITSKGLFEQDIDFSLFSTAGDFSTAAGDFSTAAGDFSTAAGDVSSPIDAQGVQVDQNLPPQSAQVDQNPSPQVDKNRSFLSHSQEELLSSTLVQAFTSSAEPSPTISPRVRSRSTQTTRSKPEATLSAGTIDGLTARTNLKYARVAEAPVGARSPQRSHTPSGVGRRLVEPRIANLEVLRYVRPTEGGRNQRREEEGSDERVQGSNREDV